MSKRINSKDALVAEYKQWLSPFPWQLFATLTFRRRPTASRADRAFETWIQAIKKAEGTASFCWFRVKEFGAFHDNLHFHAIVGGLAYPSKFPWIELWEKLAGEAHISYFVAYFGAIDYVLKELDLNESFPCDFFLYDL
jgi:hypothetical protein